MELQTAPQLTRPLRLHRRGSCIGRSCGGGGYEEEEEEDDEDEDEEDEEDEDEDDEEGRRTKEGKFKEKEKKTPRTGLPLGELNKGRRAVPRVHRQYVVVPAMPTSVA